MQGICTLLLCCCFSRIIPPKRPVSPFRSHFATHPSVLNSSCSVSSSWLLSVYYLTLPLSRRRELFPRPPLLGKEIETEANQQNKICAGNLLLLEDD
jgi:hypothetical protein